MAKKRTQAEIEYGKQVRRLKQFVRRATKRGFSFPKNVIPERPQRVTKSSVLKLQRITPSSLYEKATYIDPTTGVSYKGTEGRQIERSRASAKGAATKAAQAHISVLGGKRQTTDKPVSQTEQTLTNIIEQIKGKLESWQPSANWTEGLSEAKRKDKDTLSKMFYSKLDEIGADELAKRLTQRASEINALIEEILYASGSKMGNFKDGRTQVNADLARMADILAGHMLTPEESKALTEQTEEALVHEPNPEATEAKDMSMLQRNGYEKTIAFTKYLINVRSTPDIKHLLSDILLSLESDNGGFISEVKEENAQFVYDYVAKIIRQKSLTRAMPYINRLCDELGVARPSYESILFAQALKKDTPREGHEQHYETSGITMIGGKPSQDYTQYKHDIEFALNSKMVYCRYGGAILGHEKEIMDKVTQSNAPYVSSLLNEFTWTADPYKAKVIIAKLNEYLGTSFDVKI